MIGHCRYCDSVGELRESHILPRWVYRRIVQFGTGVSGKGASIPMQYDNGTLRRTGDQPKEHLLCGDCERIFGAWDAHIARLAVAPGGSFPGLQAVTLLKPRVPGIECEADGAALGQELGRFAASVVWRASVSTVLAEVDLGPYEEQFRRFLRGETEVLDCARLIVQLVDQEDLGMRVDRLGAAPYSYRERGCREHQFGVPGFVFTFRVGGLLPPHWVDFCFLRTRRVWVVDGLQMVQAVLERFGGATSRGPRARP
jgi:hypothetical protein